MPNQINSENGEVQKQAIQSEITEYSEKLNQLEEMILTINNRIQDLENKAAPAPDIVGPTLHEVSINYWKEKITETHSDITDYKNKMQEAINKLNALEENAESLSQIEEASNSLIDEGITNYSNFVIEHIDNAFDLAGDFNLTYVNLD